MFHFKSNPGCSFPAHTTVPNTLSNNHRHFLPAPFFFFFFQPSGDLFPLAKTLPRSPLGAPASSCLPICGLPMHPKSVPGHPSLRVPRCARGPWLWSRHPAPPRGTQRVPAPRGEGGEAEQLRNLGQKSVCSQLTPTRVTADGSGEWLRDTPHRAPRLRAPARCSQLLPPAWGT